MLLAVPAQDLRTAATALAPHIRAGTPVVACAKGIERGTHRFMTEIIAETNSGALPAILSGPSFATDVARGLPTAVTLACADEATAAALARALGSQTFRPYHTTDVRGVEIGGAAKNVLAIAAGIVAGPQARRERDGGAGHARLCRARALRPRARRAQRDAHRPLRSRRPHPHLLVAAVAQLLARHRARRRPRAAKASSPKAPSRRARWPSLRGEKGVEMPIATAVAAVLEETLTVDQAIEWLLTRPFRAECKAVTRRLAEP